MTNSTLQTLLLTGCQQLNLALTDTQQTQLLSYTQTLYQWNKTYNLTAVRDIDAMLKRHVLDALSVQRKLLDYQPKTLADIGTGAGIPGIILAITCPELQVYLVESIGKKCRFLRHVINLLGLSERVEVVQQRVEHWQAPQPLSIIICRAFTSLANFTTITAHLGDEKTHWLAMKADNTDAELEQLPSHFVQTEDILLCVPFEQAQRHLHVFKLQQP